MGGGMAIELSVLQRGHLLCLMWSITWLESHPLFCCSVAKSCLALWDPMDCSMPGFPVLHYLPELLKLIEPMMLSNHLILCRPILLLPSVFPSIRVFSKESALRIRWPKYWSFSINHSNEYSGLISFRIDWFDLAVQSPGVFSSTTIQKHQFFSAQPSYGL